MTGYQVHKEKWLNCQRCVLSSKRNHVVIARGSIPADVLFIGEAPGRSEDVTGKAFVGPAGKVLDDIIAKSLGGLSYCLTNLVGCIPLDDELNKYPEPSIESIKACNPRLIELFRLCKPKLVVMLGKLARKHTPVPEDFNLNWVRLDRFVYLEIPHPAAILRMNKAQQGLEFRRCIREIQCAVSDVTAPF